ncbi:peptidase M23 [Streptomyces sp. Tue6028]|nr:peptidase M23 [Streptomyces sp. Tue6028]
MYRTAFPRTDLRVVSHGVTVSPELAVGSHVSFIRYADNTILSMGELAVAETELHRVTGALQSHGIEQTAIHNHLLAHTPRIVWIHTHGHGPDALTLARGLRAAFDCTGTPPAKSSTTSTPAKKLKLDTAGIDAALGTAGTVYGNVYKSVFRRRETITDGSYVLPIGSGATTALSFQPVGGGCAAVSGDFAVLAGEAQDVLAALQRGGIEIVELHNHGLVDTPRMFFIHVWAVGNAVKIARALRRAVAATNATPAGGAEGGE